MMGLEATRAGKAGEEAGSLSTASYKGTGKAPGHPRAKQAFLWEQEHSPVIIVAPSMGDLLVFSFTQGQSQLGSLTSKWLWRGHRAPVVWAAVHV